MKFKIGVVLLFCVVSELGAQGFLKAEGKQIVNGKGEPIILRGMGLGGWMLQEGYMLRVQGIGQQQHVIRTNIEALIGEKKTAEFYNAWLSNHTRKIDIDSLKAWGFNSIRLPMHFDLYTLPADKEPVAGQHTWIEKGFSMTDSLLKWCAVNEMYLILDMHAAPGGQGNDLNISDRDPSKLSLWDNPDNLQKMIAVWRKLAERYKDEPWIGAYDVINEPNWGFENKEDKNGCAEGSNAPLRKLMMDVTAAIREVDKKHIIIIEGNCWGNNYNGVLPVWDNNMVLSFHKYWNYNDQGSIQRFIDMRNEHNVPVWLGESGENSNVWFRDAIQLVESNGIGWAWWPLKKLGFNNPLEVKVPANYQKVLDYWTQKGSKPTPEEAYQGLMELAENTKLENCIFHVDVVDAMFRQTTSDKTLPFSNARIDKSVTVSAVHFDLGRNGFAYYDVDSGTYWVSTGKRIEWNKGRTYRNDGVDILKDGDQYIVDEFVSSEWLQYTLNSKSKKKGTLELQIKSDAPGTINVQINGVVVEKQIIKSATWQYVSMGSVELQKGENTLRIKVIEGDYQFAGFRIK